MGNPPADGLLVEHLQAASLPDFHGTAHLYARNPILDQTRGVIEGGVADREPEVTGEAWCLYFVAESADKIDKLFGQVECFCGG